MPHEDHSDDEGLSEISFAEPSEGGEEDGDALSDLSNGLRNLNVKGPTAQRYIDIKVSSASVRKFSRESSPSGFRTHPASKREDESTCTIDSSVECAPSGWSRVFPPKP